MKKNSFAVFYDGSCGLCRKTLAVFRRLDFFRRVRIYDVLADWPEVHAKFPALNQQTCLQTMHVVNPEGKVSVGFKAYRQLMWALPLGWVLVLFLYLPFVPAIGERIYQKVASGRHRGGCPLPPPQN